MADAKNAWRKMSTAQRDAFLSSLGGPVGARPMVLWSVTLLEDRGEMPRLEFFETKAQAAARVWRDGQTRHTFVYRFFTTARHFACIYTPLHEGSQSK